MMDGTLTLQAAPAREPLTLGEVKDHVRPADDSDDAYLDVLIVAARQYTERVIGRALITQTWDWALDCFPGFGRVLVVPRPQLQSVASITYVDLAGAPQVWDAAKYQVDLGGLSNGRIFPAYEERWPDTRRVFNAVTVRFVAGFGDLEDDVPKPLRQAMLLMAAHWYDNRTPVTAGQMGQLPFGIEALLAPWEAYR